MPRLICGREASGKGGRTVLIDRLIQAIKEKKAPICVGLDPRIEDLPPELVSQYPEAGELLFAFNKAIIDEIADLVPAVKPQIAMYERYGLSGLAGYVKTLDYAKAKGLFVIGDIKRGDIGSTAEAYAEGHLGVGFKQDWITINPYMGQDSVQPFIKACETHDRGLFVLVKTSNPGSRDIQDIITADGIPVYEQVAKQVSQWGSGLIGEMGFSAVGAVVGATQSHAITRIKALMPRTFFLVPGYGAQGGSAEDVKGFFNKEGVGAIINSSRGITQAWREPKYAEAGDFAKAARLATLAMIEDLA